MPNKLQFYSEFAERTARQITGSYRSWTAFLATAARLYKYPYNEQLMIYAQRPNATACAEYSAAHPRLLVLLPGGFFFLALAGLSSDTTNHFRNEETDFCDNQADHSTEADSEHQFLAFSHSCSPFLSQDRKSSSRSVAKSSAAEDLPPRGSPSRTFWMLPRPQAMPRLPLELKA